MSADAVPDRQLFDHGLQPERTALAWRRTALALIVASLIGIRILPLTLGAWAAVPAGFGILAALLVLVLSHRRHRVVHETLVTSASDRVPLPSGGLPLLVVVMVMGGGLGALAMVLAPRLG